mgnify:CR=1 FL=1
MRLSICAKCKYCKSIDIDSNVECEKGHFGKVKSYCRDFEEA